MKEAWWGLLHALKMSSLRTSLTGPSDSKTALGKQKEKLKIMNPPTSLTVTSWLLVPKLRYSPGGLWPKLDLLVAAKVLLWILESNSAGFCDQASFRSAGRLQGRDCIPVLLTLSTEPRLGELGGKVILNWESKCHNDFTAGEISVYFQLPTNVTYHSRNYF